MSEAFKDVKLDDEDAASRVEEAPDTQALNRPAILQGENVHAFQGRAVVANILAEIERANNPEPQPPGEPYYWEDRALVAGHEYSFGAKTWHNLHWLGAQCFYGMEQLGEVMVHFMGLDQSRYQWVLDQADRDERRRLEQQEEEQQRQQMHEAERDTRDASTVDAMEGGARHAPRQERLD